MINEKVSSEEARDTEALDPSDAADVAASPMQPASWLARAGAFTVDVFFGAGVVAAVALVALSAPQGGWLWWLSVAVGGLTILAMAVNRTLLPSITGWSLGRALMGIRVVGRDGSSVEPWRLLARDFAHLLDTVSLFIGWLWPLWDTRRRTFADLLLRTEVGRVERPDRDMRRPVAVVLLGAACVCSAVVGLSYLVVYRHDQAIDAARTQIAAQGPKIVEEMLSYNAASQKDDFSHAQALATDSYRPQLIAQQRVAQKAGAVTNEYWVANGSVLSATTDHASMLLLMQGQRAADKQEPRLITATVRVNFDKSAAGQWQVADLTVLTKPQTSESGK